MLCVSAFRTECSNIRVFRNPVLCLGHGSGGRPVFWPEIGDGADSDGRAEAVPANSARRDLPGRSEPFCPFRRVLRSALVPRGPLQPVFLLSSSGLQRLSEEAGPVAFPRMPRFRPVSEPETAGMSSCAVRSACVPIGLQPKVRAFAGEGFGYCRAKILLFR